MHEGARESVSKADILFPSLETYKNDHSTIQFQKLCVEISEFLRDVYASTTSEEERIVYRNMLKKLL